MESHDHAKKQDKVDNKPKQPQTKEQFEDSTLQDDTLKFATFSEQHPPRSAQQMLQLQRLIGNRATQNLIADRKPQAKSIEKSHNPFPWLNISRTSSPLITRNMDSSHIQRAGGKIDPGGDLPDMGTIAGVRQASQTTFYAGQKMKEALEELLDDPGFEEIVSDEIINQINMMQRIGLLNDGDEYDWVESGNQIISDMLDEENLPHDYHGLFRMASQMTADQPASVQELVYYFISQADVLAREKAEEIVGEVPDVPLDMESLPRDQREVFADALKTMPTVDWLLNRGHETGTAPEGEGEHRPREVAYWQGGPNVSLTDNIYWANRDGGDGIPTNDEVGENRTMYRRTQKADQLLKRMIEPEILSMVPPPTIYIVRSRSLGFTAPKGFRPYMGDNSVFVGKNEGKDLIVHEVNHYLEDMLPTGLWQDVQTLLRSRHEEQAQGFVGTDDEERKSKVGHGGGKPEGGLNKKGISGSIGGLFFTNEEGRYRGKYAATGRYTSSAYEEDDPGTEVTSMTMEFLSTPDNARRMIEKDPVQAAIVLRQMRPNEYADVVGNAYDQYLPHQNVDVDEE